VAKQGVLSVAKQGVRELTWKLGDAVKEYSFEAVAREVIGEIEFGLDGDVAALVQRWQELLYWLYETSAQSRLVLPQLAIKVITTHKSLQRATSCYLGPAYPRGNLVCRLYKDFHCDEFVGTPAECGLGRLPIEAVEEFFIALGVHADPRQVAFNSGGNFGQFKETVVARIKYPVKIRDTLCDSLSDLWRVCSSYDLDGVQLPDRLVQLLTKGDAVAVIAFLLSSGACYLGEEKDPTGYFKVVVRGGYKEHREPSVPILNAALLLLREQRWVPSHDGRKRPSEIMLSKQEVKLLGGVYWNHTIDTKDRLIVERGGRVAVDALLTRLGAVPSLGTVGGASRYEMLLALPERDPNGRTAVEIYRTLVDSRASVEDSPQQAKFFSEGRMWGRYNGTHSYLPMAQLRYNARLAVPKQIEP
jgi:hypothetical protein